MGWNPRSSEKPTGRPLGVCRVATFLTILVVDDDNAVRDVVVRMLSANGFGVLTASDGSEALRILGQRSRQARQVRPGLKVLFGTGYAQKAIERDATRQARAVYKPFRQAELVKEIEALLAA